MKIAFVLLVSCLWASKASSKFCQIFKLSFIKSVLFHKGLTEIRVLGSKSLDGIPNIDITFPDGHQDNFVLERHYMSETERMAQKMHCNFIGHLAKDTDACVAVTGCIGDEMEFTVNSKHAGESNKFVLRKNGELELVESPFKVSN